jgi:two-component system, OmpR family, phosphate regulon response regulator PhoB
LRSVVFRFESVAAFSGALSETTGALSLPDGESVSDGEWVLAIFEIGSRRRATAAAARGVCASGDIHIEFERRDWDRLLAFVAARSEHLRVATAVVLPADSGPPPAAIEEAAPMSEMPPSSALESSRVPFGARVLLVDDDAGTRDELRAMLAEIGLVVETAETAKDAAGRMAERDFDAVVLDYHATGLDPRAFVRELRKDLRIGAMPVLMISSQPSSRDVVDAFASGADDFLPKPFRAPELGARIFGLLRRARLARPASAPDHKGGAAR